MTIFIMGVMYAKCFYEYVPSVLNVLLYGYCMTSWPEVHIYLCLWLVPNQVWGSLWRWGFCPPMSDCLKYCRYQCNEYYYRDIQLLQLMCEQLLLCTKYKQLEICSTLINKRMHFLRYSFNFHEYPQFCQRRHLFLQNWILANLFDHVLEQKISIQIHSLGKRVPPIILICISGVSHPHQVYPDSIWLRSWWRERDIECSGIFLLIPSYSFILVETFSTISARLERGWENRYENDRERERGGGWDVA